ncbi:MAG: SDR family oxidoreductase [Alphaproteobacteria bacterium]|nr:SDR family oxidoreductase [Alphaproteobacteria bacterium]
MTSDTDFTGQVVLITGGASGIGWAGALAFAERGAKVAIADLNSDFAKERAAELGAGHIGIGCDVADEAAVDRLVTEVVGAFGRLDVAVNCAGIRDQFVPTVEQSGKDFARLLDIHVTGSFQIAKRAAVEMMKNGHGVVINISSIAGFGALPRRNAYTAAKHGLIGLTKALACDWAQDGIRVNAIAPGYVDTPFIQPSIQEGNLDPDALRRRTPMGALLQPVEIANAMIFLASPLARMVTGTVLPVDGGYTAYAGATDAAIL